MDPIIVFDFDGVLADSFEALYRLNKQAAADFGKQILPEQFRDCFDGIIHDEIKRLYGFNEAANKEFLDHKRSIFSHYYNPSTVKLFNFAPNLVKTLASRARLMIVSSSPAACIRTVLADAGLEGFFSEVLGFSDGGKHLTFDRIKQEFPKASHFSFVTDTVGDIKEAQRVDFPISTIAVAWGFHSGDKLAKAKPNFLARTPQELISILG